MKLGKFKIYMFVKPSDTATMSTHRLGRFISRELNQPIVWDKTIASEDLDTLIIVAGGAAFSSSRDDLGRAVLRSERVVFASLDYMSRLPGTSGNAQTMYRKAFRLRHKRGMAPVDHWSTCEIRGTSTPDSRVINWNSLEYNPSFVWRGDGKHLLYYGSWRKNRIPIFEEYFRKPVVDTLISNGSGRFEIFDSCRHMGSIPRDEMAVTLGRAGIGLYLVDPLSEIEDHSPSGRFYEMLGAGLPMVFDRRAAPMMQKAGYDVTPFLYDPRTIKSLMRDRQSLALAQSRWRRDYVSDVRTKLLEAVK